MVLPNGAQLEVQGRRPRRMMLYVRDWANAAAKLPSHNGAPPEVGDGTSIIGFRVNDDVGDVDE